MTALIPASASVTVLAKAPARSVARIARETTGERDTLRWWIEQYLTTYATGTVSTLRAKQADLGHFLRFCQWVFSDATPGAVTDTNTVEPVVYRWNRATSNAYLLYLDRERMDKPHSRKQLGDPRWSASAKNRKIDHLRTFAKWLYGQTPKIIPEDPMRGIQRYDTPPLKAKRIDERTLARLNIEAQDLAVKRIRRDKSRVSIGDRVLRKDARPKRDFALYQLLLGSGLRINAVANLDIEQCRLEGHIKKLVAVKEKGRQEREVVISNDAADAIRDYIKSERETDAGDWNGSRALFLSVPERARQRNDTLHGRMTTRALAYIIKKLGINALGETAGKAIHPHLFRHHVGYLMNERGGITATQKQLAHRNLTYSAVYAQRTDEEQAGYLNAR